MDHIFTRYLSGGKTPPKNSAKVKKLGVGLTARKCPIGSTNNRCGMKKIPHRLKFHFIRRK
ncbi:hypothetical protein C6359_15890 [Bacillus wiedmannii]|uniref:Uncharacterized protein n=1 Tax=Bacillus wiedmannii TaxID=1890302 RepID=A0ABX5DTR2_9BACI|nr:hypothetical protein C6356_21960 [Bacillus wiedmannii]PRT33738.1 hypothetical protein C6358_15785 [Bacillus wiedmannii]PRT39224.1 hypothetical protein C6357_19750 [Bacillus wiedmannii]PRT45210.1 hypothetical protein C6359_15890 [Bacillus wiedmannii]